MYGETLGRWRTADLLIGLAYLAQRETDEHPVTDVAQHGEVMGQGLDRAGQAALVVCPSCHRQGRTSLSELDSCLWITGQAV